MIIGIDLGTTNSLVAYYENGEAKVIPNRLGKFLTPSVVAVDDENHILVGETAVEYGYLYPHNCAKVFKRTMGTDHQYNLNGLVFSSEELSSFVLRSLKEDAEVYLNQEVGEAIISVPAYFNDNQRKATKKAGELIGLQVSRIISEPTASAIAYGVGDDNRSERCMVLDLGGGTFDVTCIEYFRNIMEVHAIAGDNKLGGEDFTLVLMEYFLNNIGLTIEQLDLYTLNSLYKVAEKAKCEISFKRKCEMQVVINNTPYTQTITIKQYEEACRNLLERIRKPIEKCIKDAKLTLEDIDRVILVGGATKLSIVRDFVEEIMNIYPDYYVDPDKSVALGAALQGAIKKRDKEIEEIILTDVCPFTLGTEVVKDNGGFDMPGYFLPIIERNTVIPVSKKQTVYTAHDNQENVHIKILQGESRMATNNFLLGSLDLSVPKGPKGQEAVEITYTYDINSLLEVEAMALSTKEVKRVIIQNETNKLSQEELEKRMAVLAYLKQSPREEEENIFALLRGNRLYEESFGKDKEIIEKALDNFELVLEKGSRLEIDRTRKRLIEVLDSIEQPESSTLAA